MLQVRSGGTQRGAVRSTLRQGVASWHAEAAKAWQEKLEREAAQRMTLLQQKDFNAYLQVLPLATHSFRTWLCDLATPSCRHLQTCCSMRSETVTCITTV